MVLQAYIS